MNDNGTLMRNLNEIVNTVAEIYRRSGGEAEEYLRQARQLKRCCGPGFAIVYCWFYSVPQKWTQVEPKIFELAKHTNSFDMNKVLSVSSSGIARILKPMIFRNEISRQLKNFCRALKSEYSSWEKFAKALKNENMFELLQKLRRYKDIRVTFKNLAAMKILVDEDDNLLIPDRHVAQIMGLNEKKLARCKVQEKSFRELLNCAETITKELEKRSFEGVSTTKWSLAIWFNRSGILANALLKKSNQIKDATSIGFKTADQQQ